MTPQEKLHVICMIVRLEFNLTKEEIFKKTRKRNIVLARQFFHYFARELTNNKVTTFTFVGDYHDKNKFDHATVLYSCRNISNLTTVDKGIRELNLKLRMNINKALNVPNISLNSTCVNVPLTNFTFTRP